MHSFQLCHEQDAHPNSWSHFSHSNNNNSNILPDLYCIVLLTSTTHWKYLMFMTVSFCYSSLNISVKKPVQLQALQAPFHIACLVIPTADLFSWKFLCINRVVHVSDISSVGCPFLR